MQQRSSETGTVTTELTDAPFPWSVELKSANPYLEMGEKEEEEEGCCDSLSSPRDVFMQSFMR